MADVQKFEFDTVNLLLDKVNELIKENIDKVMRKKLAYKTDREGNKYILEVLILD